MSVMSLGYLGCEGIIKIFGHPFEKRTAPESFYKNGEELFHWYDFFDLGIDYLKENPVHKDLKNIAELVLESAQMEFRRNFTLVIDAHGREVLGGKVILRKPGSRVEVSYCCGLYTSSSEVPLDSGFKVSRSLTKKDNGPNRLCEFLFNSNFLVDYHLVTTIIENSMRGKE